MFDDATEAHHHHVMADVSHDGKVVRDEDKGEAHAFLQVHQEVDDLGLDRDVQRRDGFVADDELRPPDQGPGDTDALCLTARQFMRVTVREIGREADLPQSLDGAGAGFGAGETGLEGGERAADDAGERHPRVEGSDRVLEDDLHLGPAAAQVGDRGHVLPLPQDLPSGRRYQTQERPAEGGLAAAGFADDAKGAARLQREGNLVDDGQ